MAIAAGIAAYKDEAYFKQCQQQVIAEREWLTQSLIELGFEVLPSAANFVFTRHPQQDAAILAAGLREKGVIVRHFKKPRIDQFLRISVGNRTENQLLMSQLDLLV